MKKITCIILILISYICVYAQVIPLPAEVKKVKGKLFLNNELIILNNSDLLNEIAFLKNKLLQDYAIISYSEGNKKTIELSINKELESESYNLLINKDKIKITGGDNAGVFYGIQSLLQIINATPYNSKNERIIPCCEIKDKPRYSWRGFMLDESRHFFGKEKVKQLLDFMAFYKLNKFHWHLTDEPAWRLEIKQYPKLSSVGGSGNWHNPKAPVLYYTQEEVKEIINYAAALHIEVIPEIDMPGHATAANRAYPEYSGGTADPRYPDFTFNPGKEETYSFLTNILRETGNLFPSNYLHIGGDEVSFGNKSWEELEDVKNLRKNKNLDSLKDVEKYFINRMIDTVVHLNKTLIGWDELLEIDADPAKTVIMWWRHDKVNLLKKSLDRKYPTILCPRRPLYFDFVQHEDHKWGRKWDGFNTLAQVYNFPESGFNKWQLSKNEKQYIIGLQANLWTEKIHNNQRFDYMTYPRLCAFAEAAWTNPLLKNFAYFKYRLEFSYELFSKKGIQFIDYRNINATPEPEGVEHLSGKKVE